MPPVAGEQERNLKILAAVAACLLALLVFAGVALYAGWELPPNDLRAYSTSASGYAPPAHPGIVPAGTVARGSLAFQSPGEAQALHSNAAGTSGEAAAAGAPRAHPDPEAEHPLPQPVGNHPALPMAAPTSAAAGNAPAANRLTVAPTSADALRNPLAGDPGALALGARAYQVSCAMCHGKPGQSIGPVGEAYVPRPPRLDERISLRSEGALYDAITSGIRSTPTPEAVRYLPQEWHAFREGTSARERWAIVAYLRATFQTKGPRPPPGAGQ